MMVPVDDYELIDAGGGARLERFGDHITDRPHGGALADRRDPGRWAEAGLRFDRDGGWSGPGLAAAADGWTVRIHGIAMELRPTDAGQVGLFPEHADRLGWLADQIARRLAEGHDPEVLNLFAYTGLTTLAMAGWGARVTHVDSARPSVAWARRNAALNGVEDRPIRWIVDDARAYAAREVRRGRRYDGILLDPPTYGHGAGGAAAWRLDEDLPDLLGTVADLLAADGFVLLTAHTEGYSPDRLAALLSETVDPGRRGAGGSGDLELGGTSGTTLQLGAYAHLAGAV